MNEGNGESGFIVPKDDAALEEWAKQFHTDEGEEGEEDEGAGDEELMTIADQTDQNPDEELDPYEAQAEAFLAAEEAKERKQKGGGGGRTGGKTNSKKKAEQLQNAYENRQEEATSRLTSELSNTYFTKKELSESQLEVAIAWVIASVSEDRAVLISDEDGMDASEDFEFETVAGASTKGGQHANKNSTGIKAVHKITGISARGVTRDRENSKREALSSVKEKLEAHIENWGMLLSDLKPDERKGEPGATRVRRTLEKIKNPEGDRDPEAADPTETQE